MGETMVNEHFSSPVNLTVTTDMQYYSYETTGRQSMTEKAKLSIKKQCACTTENFKKLLFALLPICQWLPKYNLTKLLKDFLPGLTIGVMQIPQGLAEANLAGVPPVFGLYSSFFPSLIYFFVGTSFLTSFGSVSLVSLMVGNARYRLIPNDTSNDISVDGLTPIDVATSLCLLVGIMQVIAGILHLGFFASYLSEPLMRAYATGCAFYVIIAQVPGSFGLTLQRREGPLQLFYTTYDLFANITETKIPTLITTVICTLAIILTKSILDPWIHKKLKIHIPVPIDLIVVIIGTACSYSFDFSGIWGMTIVGVIPTGFPTPLVPRIDIWPRLVPDAIAIAVVSYCLSLSMGQILGKRNNYEVPPNQECFAIGVIQTSTSFFQCYSSSASLSRSLVLDSINAKTQISGLIGNVLVMIVILWLAPLLQSLPKCILAAIILANLKRLLLQFSDLKFLWSRSKIDFLIWLITFIAVFIMNVTWGLMIGVAFAILTVLLRSQWPDVHVQYASSRNLINGQTLETEKVSKATTVTSVVFRFDAPLYFANTDIFKKKITKLCHLHFKSRPAVNQIEKNTSTAILIQNDTLVGDERDSRKLDHFSIVVDCSGVSYVDTMGIAALEQLYEEMKQYGVLLLFCNCNASMLHMLDDCKLYDLIPQKNFFTSLKETSEFVQNLPKPNSSQKS